MKNKQSLIICCLLLPLIWLSGCDLGSKNESPESIDNTKTAFSPENISESINLQKVIDEYVNLVLKTNIKDLGKNVKYLEAKKINPLPSPKPTAKDGIPITSIAQPSSLEGAGLMMKFRSELAGYGRDYKIEAEDAENAVVLLTFFDKKDPDNNNLGSKWYYRFHLVKQEGNWKILEVEFDPLKTKPKKENNPKISA